MCYLTAHTYTWQKKIHIPTFYMEKSCPCSYYGAQENHNNIICMIMMQNASCREERC